MSAPRLVTQLPSRIAENPASGWTVYSFTSDRACARFFEERQDLAMPCWKRMSVIDGLLYVVR